MCRIAWSSISPRRRARFPATQPAKLTVDGRYLYGAPASALDLEGEIVIGPAKERPGSPATSSASPTRRSRPSRKPLEDLPQTDDKGKASFEVALDKLPATSRPLEAKVIVRLAEAGGRAVERKITLPVVAAGNMIGVKPLFSGRSLGEGENATFDVVLVAPDGKMLAGQRAALRAAQDRVALSVVPPRRPLGV